MVMRSLGLLISFKSLFSLETKTFEIHYANKVGRPAREGSAPVTWSIRGVEPDTRRVIEKAAERAGKKIGQYVNEDVRSFAQGQLTQSQLPAAPIDHSEPDRSLDQDGRGHRYPLTGARQAIVLETIIQLMISRNTKDLETVEQLVRHGLCSYRFSNLFK